MSRRAGAAGLDAAAPAGPGAAAPTAQGISHSAPGLFVQRTLLEPGLGLHGVSPVPAPRRGLEAALLPRRFLDALAPAKCPLGLVRGLPLCFDLERGIVERRQLLGVQPCLRAKRIRSRPLAEGLADGLVAERPGRLLAQPGHGGRTVPSAPVLGHDARAFFSVVGLRMLHDPRGSALGIPLRRRVDCRPEDRALEYLGCNPRRAGLDPPSPARRPLRPRAGVPGPRSRPPRLGGLGAGGRR